MKAFSKTALSTADLLARWQAKGPQASDKPHFADQQSYYCLAVVMRLFSHPVDPNDEWPVRLLDLFKAHTSITPADLGFPAGWEADPLWN